MTLGRLPSDPLLDGILNARTDTERDSAVAEILAEHAYDRIERILTSRFRRARMDTDHVADLQHEVIVRLVSRFHRLVHSEEAPIESFSSYVATIAINAFEDFVRKRYPLRWMMRNRTLYALTHDPALAVWTHAGISVCGLAAWNGDGPDDESPVTLPARDRKDLRLTLREVFASAGAPRTLEDVVSVLSAAAGIPRNETPRSLDEATDVSSTAPDPMAELANLQYLRTLWKEIRELPLLQRRALLLQARDATGESVTHLLPLAGIATTDEIGRSLEMSDRDFASLWPGLPADDLTLAKQLNVTRQQVINLRRAARARLLRRMHEPPNGRRV